MDGTTPVRPERPDVVGVLGGMGPLATADFFMKLVQVTPAEHDADHIPVVISCEPQIPSRPKAFYDPDGQPSPLPALVARRDRLIAAGAGRIVIPCNTAHYWFDALTADSAVPFIHIVHATADALDTRGAAGATVGIIGTEPTLDGGLYATPLTARGYRCVAASADVMERLVRPGIDHVKANRIGSAAPLFQEAVETVLADGADIVILGCTEVPAGLPMDDPLICDRTIDPTEALAVAARDWSLAVREKVGL
jgi:aspartate racemase